MGKRSEKEGVRSEKLEARSEDVVGSATAGSMFSPNS
jgi:hypothetical protein